MINIITICSILLVVGIGYYIYSSYNKNIMEEIPFKTALELTDLPIITMYIEDKKINFLLDTGSTNSIIDKSCLKFLKHEKSAKSNNVSGMEGNVVKANNVILTLNYNNSSFSSSFMEVDMSKAFDRLKKETGVTLNGILGVDFFNKYKYVIDFNKLIASYKKTKK